MATIKRTGLAAGEHRATTYPRSRSERSRAKNSPKNSPRIVGARERSSIAALATIGSVVAGAAIYGSRFSPSAGRTRAWYERLEKPPFNPPDAVFAPVWTVLYAMMAISAWRVWRRPRGRERSVALALWGAQLVANAMWNRIFFGEKRPKAALADILALLASIAAYTAVTRKVDRPAAAMMLPYGAWVSFATVLNEEIVRRNS